MVWAGAIQPHNHAHDRQGLGQRANKHNRGLRLQRRRRGQNSSHTSKQAIEAVHALARICTDQSIASFLNRNGMLTGRGNRWTLQRVTALRSHHGIACYRHDQREQENLTEAARTLVTSARTLREAVERGEISAEHPLPDGP